MTSPDLASAPVHASDRKKPLSAFWRSQLKLNARLKDTAEEIFLMSGDIVTELNAAVVEHIGRHLSRACWTESANVVGTGCLYSVSDSVGSQSHRDGLPNR